LEKGSSEADWAKINLLEKGWAKNKMRTHLFNGCTYLMDVLI
jgi:hypothetical protein